jgi:REP element-mobilizing transposase RayT
MTRPRSTLVSARNTPYYHCIGRCVRRSFLCGKDPVSGKSFDHRKQLILDRLTLLTEVFAIDLCAYALMSNHYHLVLRLDPERAQAWTDRDVVERWRRLYAGPPCIDRFVDHDALDSAEEALLADCIPRWRHRLTDLSWFMRCLNEYVARVANAEDDCKGRFWEGRFKSQALLDEEAVLTVMTYVDLNPIRAGLAETIDASEFTSGRQRLREIAPATAPAATRMPALLPFAQALRADQEAALPFNVQDYLDLLDTTGRAVHPAKRGAIPETIPRLLTTLDVAPQAWVESVVALHARFRSFIGSPHRLSALAEERGWRWIRGQSAARRLYCRVNA